VGGLGRWRQILERERVDAVKLRPDDDTYFFSGKFWVTGVTDGTSVDRVVEVATQLVIS
jgi:hypothetical protein